MEPASETVAIAALLLLQLTGRSVNTLPDESFKTTLACPCAPGAIVDGITGMLMLATRAAGGGPTVIDASALFPSLAAVIVAAPTPAPVTTPVAETTAIF
jgi:hypothetical protein